MSISCQKLIFGSNLALCIRRKCEVLKKNPLKIPRTYSAVQTVKNRIRNIEFRRIASEGGRRRRQRRRLGSDVPRASLTLFIICSCFAASCSQATVGAVALAVRLPMPLLHANTAAWSLHLSRLKIHERTPRRATCLFQKAACSLSLSLSFSLSPQSFFSQQCHFFTICVNSFSVF